ncbi:immunity 26/phosphotriesterase HocA family protein [Hungatella hathewayi]|uniref:immunity 26/phosphotriesterase HocA family protein n=1 Tax=Hungatella hathewayi TaxID=154046 RepID=UPI00356768D8
MGTALVVKVYHKISDSMEVNVDELEQGLSLPPQAIMDNRIYYGEYKIIGNRAVTYRDLDDGPISTSKSINYQDRWYHTDYRDEGIGFSLNLDHLEECITAHSNEPYYGSDVRNGIRGRLSHPLNKKDKNAIFEAFGLDGNLDYEGNLKLHRASKD